LDQLLESVGEGRSTVLVVRGEPGVGKTALLEYLVDRASVCRIAQASGVESEMELAFAGLHQLCGPMLNRLDHLPGPQREALGTAFGQHGGEPPDRFLVGLGVLGLLSEIGEDRPLICLVDDAQWLDQASAQTLAFVARRLLAESVGLVVALRDSGDEDDWTGLPELVVSGLDESASRALLDSALPGRLDEPVRDRILAEARGNPLALLELPRGLGVAELAGGFGAPAAPLAGRLEQSFADRVQSLPRETQQLMLLAAAEPIGDVTLLWRAAGELGIGPEAAAPAQAAGLIEFGVRVRFRHPLVRSAAYRAAAPTERQVAHQALAAATDPGIDPDRRAWHLAQAATGPDESVADELDASACRAEGRGGLSAAAAFLDRAAELTPDSSRRAERALTAAQAKMDAGASDRALELLASAELGPLDELQRARLERLRAKIAFARRRGIEAPTLLLDAAKHLEPLDAGLARLTYLEALEAGIFTGRFAGGDGLQKLAQAARAAPSSPLPPRKIDLLLDGLAIRFTEGYAAALPSLRRALTAFWDEDAPNEEEMNWPWWPVAIDLWDDETLHELSRRAINFGRGTGSLGYLPGALTLRASVYMHAGELAAASALIDEADAITEATGQLPYRYARMVIACSRGREGPALRVIDAAVRDATARGEGRVIGLADYSAAVLYNGLARYEAAVAAARRACEYDDLGLVGNPLVELVEAGVRCDARDAAVAALERLEPTTTAAGSSWALGVRARSRALLTDGPLAEAHYREAVDHLARSRNDLHRARAHLVYGEWLRREKRRLDARGQLRTAYDLLVRMGAEAFAERARTELQATGETVHKQVETRYQLTAQEAHIARLAATGHTNPEIGAQLFLSPRTVEWHLGRVFGKLGIRSRRELREALPTAGPAVLPA
jgi:DNA-binding CsgD family transcriptional regulator